MVLLAVAPYLPVEFDDTVDASHGVLPLAIFRAFIEARRRTGAAGPRTPAVPQLWTEGAEAICCDNFS
jgi:hypothetical protein